MKIYEIMFVCNKFFIKNLYTIVEKIKYKFKNNILYILNLGIRKLSYKINKEKEAYYFLIFSKRKKNIINYILKKIKYKTFLLRYIFLKSKKKYILKKILE